MKRYAILSLFVLLTVGVIAQQARPQAAMKLTKDQTDQMVTRYTDKASQDAAIKAFGDVIFEDDFGTGGPAAGNLPTGWTTTDVDSQGNNYVWQWTNVGAQGPTTTGYEHVLASATAANGWMILDSDNYGQGSYDAMLISPTYNLSGHDAVAISFTELYKRWGTETTNPYGANPTLIGVSTDGGTTWTEIEIHAEFASKDETDNPGYMTVNISNIAGGASQLKIYFRMKGLWDYWWQVDDFKLIEAPYNDLVMKDNFIVSYWDYGTQAALYGYYSMLPLSQITPFYMEASVYNNGINTSTHPVLSSEVTSGSTVVGTFTATTDSIEFDSTYVFSTDLFETTVSGDFSVQYEVAADSTDEQPLDNESTPITWSVTDNDIMARDFTYTIAISPSMFTGAADGDLLGLNYFIANAATAKSVSVFVDYRATVGSQLIAQIYYYDGTSWVKQIQGEEYAITAADLGHWVELPLFEITAGDADLDAATEYMVGIEFYWGNDADAQPWIGADDEGPHAYSLVTNLRLGSTWYWVTYVPMIRLNLETATVPPTWTNILSDLCAHPSQAGTYTRTVSATDAAGLPLTFTATDNDIMTSFVDNGNGTASFTFDVTSANIDEQYLFEYTVSNGVASNNVFAYLTVASDADCFLASVEYDQLLNVAVYPNPSNGVITIDNANQSKVNVLNVLGEVVLSADITSTQQSLNISNLAEGTYYVKVMTQQGTVTKSINLVK